MKEYVEKYGKRLSANNFKSLNDIIDIIKQVEAFIKKQIERNEVENREEIKSFEIMDFLTE